MKDLKQANKTVIVMKKNPLSVKFPCVRIFEASIVVVSDASYANLPDGSSQGGYVIFMVDSSGRCCPLSWQSRKIRKVCKSTLAAEGWSLVEGLDAAELIVTQLNELFNLLLPVVCFTDCKSLYNAVQTSNTLEDKGLRIPSMACLRQKYNQDEVKMK